MTQIIFNSQEEFEDAVMEVLEKRLSVVTNYGESWYSDQQVIEVSLQDNKLSPKYFAADTFTIFD